MEYLAALNALDAADRSDLTTAWEDAFNTLPPSGTSQPFMRMALSFHIQSKQFGGLDTKTKRRVKQVQNTLSVMARPAKPRAPKLIPGAQLLREWNGTTHRIDVLNKGFRWNGKTFRSLSAIATAITGTRLSGPRFFGLAGSEP